MRLNFPRQHCPCRELRSFQMRQWQRPNEQQLMLHLLLLLQHQIELAPAAVPVRSGNRHSCASSCCKACCSGKPPLH